MQELSNTLKSGKTKRELITLVRDEGMNITAAAALLGIPRKTCADFLNQRTHINFWEKYEAPVREEIPDLSDVKKSDYVPLNEIDFKELERKLTKIVEERNTELFGEQTEIPHVGAKILYFDVETAPISAAVWGLWDNNVSLNMIQSDWYLLSFCAKWSHSDEVIYFDKRSSWEDEDDSEILQELWSLLDQADIVIGQNSKKFDEKKVNARFILNGMKPPSHYRSIDTLQIAKRHFGFTSNKLEYMSDKLCKRYKKLTHGKFAGYELWKQCLVGNIDAWDEMMNYNIHDVLALEELYHILRPYFRGNLNLNVYSDTNEFKCVCGNDSFSHNGYHYTNASKFDRFKCESCGASVRGKINLLSKEKRASLKPNIA